MDHQPKQTNTGDQYMALCGYLEAIIDSAAEPIVTTNINGSIEIFNQAAAEMFGYTSDDVYGKDVSTLLDVHNSERQITGLEVFGNCRGGRTIPLSLTIRSISTAGKKGFSYLLRDASPQEENNYQPRTYSHLVEAQVADRIRKLTTQNRNLLEMARVDPLTNIANRRHFDEKLANEYRRSARDGRALSILMCDIDCFKNYNDTYGHIEGDKCLKNVAQLLKNTCRRPGDFVARYGGEEFVAILPDCDVEHAMEVASQIKTNLLTQQIAHRASAVAEYVTVSMGVASVRPTHSGRMVECPLMQADEALYRAKLGGRNQVAQAA